MEPDRLPVCALAITCAVVMGACAPDRDPQAADEGRAVPAGILPAPNQTAFLDYPVDGVDLGQGWHREGVRKAVATCIDFTTRKDSGQEQSMELSVVTDSSALMDALDVSAEAQFKSIGYSATGKVQYAKETTVEASSLNMLAYARVMNGVEYVAPAESGSPRRVDLAPYYRDLARRPGGRFEQECGDGFVAAVYSGAELTALLSLEESDEQKRTDFEAALSGSTWGFSAEAKATGLMREGTTNAKLHVTFHQTGGSGSPMPTTQEGFVRAIEQLPALAAKDAYNYRIQVQSYRSLPGYPAGTTEEPDGFRQAAATSYGRLLTLLRAVAEALELAPGKDYVDAHKDQRDTAIRDRMQALHDELMTKLRRIRAFSESCTFYDPDEESPKTETEAAAAPPCRLEQDLDLRKDYEYRLRLPVLLATVANSKDPARIRAAIVDRYLRDVSRRRCERDLEDPGCLLEREIQELSKKLSG